MNTLNRAEHLTILGKDKDGRPISLLAGFLQRYNLLAPELSPAAFHFDRAFLGTHFLNEDNANLTELSARIPAIDHWLGISGFTIDLPRSQSELTIRFSQPEDIKFELEPGLKLVFGFGWRGPSLRRPQLEASFAGQESKAVKPSRRTPYIFRLNVLFMLHCLLVLGLSPDEARQHVERNDRLRQMVQFGEI